MKKRLSGVYELRYEILVKKNFKKSKLSAQGKIDEWSIVMKDVIGLYPEGKCSGVCSEVLDRMNEVELNLIVFSKLDL